MSIEKTLQKNKLSKLLIVICTLLWFVGFTYQTGFGKSYQILEKTKTIVIFISVCCLIFGKNKYNIRPKNVFLVCVVFYILIYNYLRYNNSIVDYLWVWLIIPIIRLFIIEKKDYKWIAYIFGIASTGVLLIGNTTDIFEKWDGNSVSMVQFFSYTVFISVFSEVKKVKNIRNIVIFSVIYFYLLNTFESRSAILFSTIMLLCMLPVIPFRKCLNKTTIFIILLLPLIIAIFVTSINNSKFVENINFWSIGKFNKTIFNGRDFLWEDGIRTWKLHPFIGNGDFSYRSYHNSSINALVAVGAIGYSLLIGVIYAILKKGLKWKNDSIVYGLTTSFLVIWMQQSVELGIIAEKPNVIPYLILGLIYTRIHTLEGKKDDTYINNNTDLQHWKIPS